MAIKHPLVSENSEQQMYQTIKFYSHQLMHIFIQPYISLLSYIKIT